MRSILGRYLEHSRIFYFENSGGAQPHVYAGSADWMPRNFYRRIEAVFPVEEPALRDRLIGILETYLKDTKHARVLRANGAYHRATRKRKGVPLFTAHSQFAGEAMRKRKRLEVQKEEETVSAPKLQVIGNPTDRSAPPEEDAN